jgi:hypothetical protein
MVPSGEGGRGGEGADLAPSLHTAMPAPTFTEIRKTVDNYSYSFVYKKPPISRLIKSLFFVIYQEISSFSPVYVCNYFNSRIHIFRRMDDGRSFAQSSFALKGLGH